MATKIQIRRDTAANWTSANPTLSSGELGYEIDTDKVKVGDGTTAWTSLAYLIDPSSVVSNIVDDTTPQLGGNLDVNDNLILNATGPVKLQAGSADYVKIVNSSGDDKVRFSDQGGVQAFGTFHQFGDPSSGRGDVSIYGSTSGFFTGSGSLKIHDNDSSAYVGLTVPTAVSVPITFTLPGADGTNGQVMVTDGSGNLSFATPAAGGISNLVEDTTPQLGGELDTNGNNIRLINGTLSMQAGANSGSIYGSLVYLGNLLGTAGTLIIEGDGSGTAGRLDATGDITLNNLVYPSADGTNGQVLTTDGAGNLSFADAAAAETTTTLTADSVNQRLVFTNETGTPANIDLSWAVDDTNLSRITSGSVNGSTGIATFTRDDASTFTVDFSALFDDTNLTRITSGSLSGTTLTLTRSDATTVSVNLSSLDSRYQPAGTYNTIIGTDSDINTSGSTIIDNIFVTDGVITSMGTRTLTPADIGALPTSVANQEVNTNSNVTFGNVNINGNLNAVDDIYLANRIMHEGDTDTFMQFHAANEWRVFTGGVERLEVNNSNTTVQNDLIVNGGDITLGGTGRIQGIDTVSANTDAANKLYVDNAVAGAGGGISNVVEDTTPQLGGNLDLNGKYIGVPTANISAVDIGSGSIFNVDLQGSLAMQIYKDPFATPPSFDMYGEMTIRNGSDLRFQDTNDSIIGRHSTRGVTELFTRYATTPTSIFLNVGSDSYTNIHWISTNLTSNVTLNVNGIIGGSDPSVSINTISVLAYCDVTDYIVNDINIDGINYSIRWAGGSPPVPTTGTALNLFTFTIIYDASFPVPQVLGAHQGF